MDLWKRVRYCVEMEERRFDGLLKLYTKILFNTYPYSGRISVSSLMEVGTNNSGINDRISTKEFAACQSHKMN